MAKKLKAVTQTKETKESELYPKLVQFCKSIGIKALEINAQRSNRGKKGENEWRYPDVVGFKDIAAEKEDYTMELMTALGINRSELYSFEVKRDKIDKSNLRGYILETIANSSWANRSYLVAEGVVDEIKQSLEELCKSFNLGFIILDKDEPKKSKIVFEASKTELNWAAINKLAEVSEDFQKYTDYVVIETKRFVDTNIIEPNWDSSIIEVTDNEN